MDSPRDAAATSSDAAPSGRIAALLGAIARFSTTRANAHAGMVADVSISAVLIGAGLVRDDLRMLPALVTIALGLLLFSLIEYAFHRWLFHGPVELFARGHLNHHEQPQAYESLPFFLPPVIALALAWVLAQMMPVTYALLAMGATAAGYASYGLAHTGIHHIRFRAAPARRWAASHHVHHHQVDTNYGVTTPLWDFVFGTRYRSTRIAASE